MKIKQIIKLCVPPIVVILWHKCCHLCGRPTSLFLGDDNLFKQVLAKTSVYAEYGVGQSTLWVSEYTKAQILAVDTSQEWVDHVCSKINASSQVSIEWVDLGPLGEWGTPLSYEKRDHIHDYLNSIWSHDVSPEVVLIDGRFRLACFFYSLLQASPGTIILFDDYADRPHFHVVEEVLLPTQYCGRQAYFVVPEKVDHAVLKEYLAKFLYVMS